MGNTPTKEIEWIPWQMLTDSEQAFCIARVEPYVKRDPYGYRVPLRGVLVDATRGVDVRPILHTIAKKRNDSRPYILLDEDGGYSVIYIQNFNESH
jgi:hypothetical protein